MAISAKSKILASDINTALSGKQDALGYTPVKSVNGVTVDAEGNVNAVSSMIPDYNSGIAFSSTTTYTAPAAGLVVWTSGSAGMNGSFNGGNLSVNGVLVDTSSQYNYSAEIGVTTTKHAFVDTNDIVTFNRSASGNFYPCKGAI